jgi:hypothetical protein
MYNKSRRGGKVGGVDFEIGHERAGHRGAFFVESAGKGGSPR